MPIDFTVMDAAGGPWTLSEHLDAAAVITFHRGDFWSYCHGQLAVMAMRHEEFLARGGRVYGLSADTPMQNAAMIEKLALPFPILADPDRDQAVTPLGFADEKDPRQIARPGTLIVTPEAEVAYRIEGRDYADRPNEDEILQALEELDLEPTKQDPPAVGKAEAGDKAMSFQGLGYYFRGAKFATLALRGRHRELGADFRDDAKGYAEMVDRYLDALSAVEDRTS